MLGEILSCYQPVISLEVHWTEIVVSGEYWPHLIHRAQIEPGCSNLLFMPLSQSYFCIHGESGLVSNSPTEMSNNSLITGILQITAENDIDQLVVL